MRQMFLCIALLGLTTSFFGQATPAATPKPKTKTSTAAKAPVKKPAVPAGNPTAVFNTTAGMMHCTLFEKDTPVTVENFIGLATGKKDWKNPASGVTKHNTPLYDGTIFHRVIPEFMAQGGDPLGTGTGDPGYRFKDEFVDTLTFDRPGRLAMANSGPNTNGSQFFITEVPTPWLNGKHTIFGQCDDATVALVKKIARLPQDARNMPLTPIRIVHLTIQRGAPTSTMPKTKPPVHKSTGGGIASGAGAKKPAAGTAPKKPETTPQ